MNNETNIISEEDAEILAKELDNFQKGTVIEEIQNLPSNNGVEVNEDPEVGVEKIVNTSINPDTGESQVFNTEVSQDLNKSFEERLSDTIENNDIELDNRKPVSAKEFAEVVMSDDSVLKELANGTDLTPEDIKVILDVTNRKIQKEDFNIYKALPETVQTMINNSIGADMKMVPVGQMNAMKKSIANMIIDNFIGQIQQERAKYDFAHELASLYKEGTKEIEDAALDAHYERNKIYREAAEKIEDSDKKERMLKILDSIDDAKDLKSLKEFASKCKIKKIELEKPAKVYNQFLNKYKNSANNIYDINIAVKALIRNINRDLEEQIYSDDSVYAFFIAFCKQVKKFDESIATDHAYMYYVLYYSVLTDADDSIGFINNVREVVEKIKQRNTYIK